MPTRDDAWVRLLLAVAGATVVALGGVSLAIARGGPEFTFAGTTTGSVALLAAGWAVAAAGLAFWLARPRNRFGPALLVTSALWFVGEWGNPGSGSDLTFTVGLLLASACMPLVVWIALAYPSGHLRGWLDRAVCASAIGASILLGVLPTLYYDPAADSCSRCPANLALVSAEPNRWDDLAAVGFRVVAATAIVASVMALWRLGRSSAARWRVAGPVTLAAVVYLVAHGWTALRSAEPGFIGGSDDIRRLWFIQAGALVGVAAAVLWGRVRVRATRSSLARLVIELSAAAGGGLRDLLARTLGDDTLALAYPVGAGDDVDARGQPVDTRPADGRAATPIVRDGALVATVLHRPGLLDDPEVVDEVASAARLALDNERLQADLRVREAELRASRARVVAAGDAERRNLERDLHDGAQQRLMGLLLGVRLARVQEPMIEEDERLVDAAAVELQHAVDALRDIAHGLHPAVLSDDGLAGALEALAERGHWPMTFRGIPDHRLPLAIEHVAYRAVADTSRLGPVEVIGRSAGDRFVLDIAAAVAPPAVVELEDRVGAVDGSITVTPDGGGCRVHLELPLRTAACA